jgi:hypothetical protein
LANNRARQEFAPVANVKAAFIFGGYIPQLHGILDRDITRAVNDDIQKTDIVHDLYRPFLHHITTEGQMFTRGYAIGGRPGGGGVRKEGGRKQ